MPVNDPSTNIENLALLNKATGDSLRLQILQLLEQDSFGVLELADIFDVSQSRMSHHLKILASAQLVSTRREGNSIFYRRTLLNGAELDDVRNSIFVAIDAMPWHDTLRNGLNNIYTERGQQSQLFFEKHAGKFTDITDLIAGYEHYAESLEEVLKTIELPKSAHAMEVGPGQGGFLKPLSERFATVYALDNSPAMLELAKQHRPLANVEFVLGEPFDAVTRNITVDLLAFNMVVHHIPAPAEALTASAKLLNKNGYLLITDLCPHDQNWVKESCGDVWLGLDPEEVKYWAKAAGLTHQHQVFVGLRNGFQIQIQLFKKP
ncbi:metalloregulator ArsR/SmtB family transcription factor [Pseudomonas sp. HK3]